MSKLNSREEWEEFYNERKTERDKVISALSANDDDSLDQLWWFCWYNVDKLTDKHPQIWSKQTPPHERHFSVHSDSEDCFLVKFRKWNKTKGQYWDEEIFKVDKEFFAKTLKFFRRDTIQRDNQPVEGKFNIYDKSGAGRNMDYISLRSVLPMISLGIFELGGKDWIEYTDSSKIRVGDSKMYYISFSGPGTSRHPSSIPAEITDEETTAEVLEICDLLELRSNVILEGVPGTGKTWIRDKVKAAMDAEMEVVTFHPASTYEEFVGGIFPTSSNGPDGKPTLLFEYQQGTLSRFANRAMVDDERDYILFIDEINRANIPLVMGELLTIIESTKRTKPGTLKQALSNGPNSDGKSPWEVAVHVENDDTKSKYLRLPSNLYILATMNTSDRSVVSMDAALRRRFAYYRIDTKLTDNGREEMRTALKESWWGDKQDIFETVFEILVKINQHLQREIGPDAMLGHSYLFFSDDEVAGLDENQVVSEMMELNILPQIADTLTSMNKTSEEDVDSINQLLRIMPDAMLRHELKSPTAGGKSLDIAVTVCRKEVGLVIKDNKGIYLFSERNEKIDSQFSIEECDDDVHLVLHAQGGGYNTEYNDGLERLIDICRNNELQIIELRNESSTWKKNTDSDSDLVMDFNYPILPWEYESRELRLEIGRKTGTGSPNKRIKLIFMNIWGDALDEIERLFSGIQD